MVWQARESTSRVSNSFATRAFETEGEAKRSRLGPPPSGQTRLVRVVFVVAADFAVVGRDDECRLDGIAHFHSRRQLGTFD